ncbi:MAG: SsrA-binding protein SmpB [Alphaproteobacteria bacterium]
MASPQKSGPPRKIVAENRKARHSYEIHEVFEAGMVLTGSEVKSLRLGRSNIAESYATDDNGELYVINAYIPGYTEANRFNHEERRPRKLLMHKRQIAKLIGAVRRDGMTLVPLKIYFNDRGRAKLELALARGRKLHDKRQAEKTRDWNRQKARLMRDKG